VAQLEHQDPLSPMDNVEFTAQLAQFNGLERMEAMNQSLQALLAAQEITNTVQATNFIGKEVQAQGNTVYLNPGQSSELSYHLGADSAEVTIIIFNESGNLVQTIKQPTQNAGDHVVNWDGKDAQGNSLPEGEYLFLVSAKDTAGNTVPVETFIQGRVEEVGYVANRPYLVVNGNQVDVSAVVSVKAAQ
jgi:flagellar basal-body rod modification protein FlgD